MLSQNLPVAIAPIYGSSKVNDYKHSILSDAQSVECRATLWGIKEKNVSLRLGRYNKYGSNKKQILGEDGIKQGLTLNYEELKNLIINL